MAEAGFNLTIWLQNGALNHAVPALLSRGFAKVDSEPQPQSNEEVAPRGHSPKARQEETRTASTKETTERYVS